MAQKPRASTTTSQQSLLSQLRSPKAKERLEAAQDIGQLASINKDLSQALEQAALHDKDKSVRYWAQKALQSPAYQAAQSKSKDLEPDEKEILVGQIDQWQKEGLINKDLAKVLRARYREQPAPAFASIETSRPAQQVAKPAQPRKAQPKRSLGEILFSQTTINIALFLGAFFVLAAALILAALNASLRTPILLVVTLLFLGGALSFRKRLPSASLTLFVVYSLLVPILANVVLETAAFPPVQQKLFWLLVTVFLTANWAFATRQYHSRLFALFAFGAFNSLPFQFTGWVDAPTELALFLASLTSLISLAIAFRIKQQKDKVLFNPLLVISQIWQALLLLFIFASVVPDLLLGERSSSWMLALAGALLVASFFYHLSLQNIKSSLFPYLAMVCLLVIPWIILQTFSVDSGPAMFITWLWGSSFALLGHSLFEAKKNGFHPYGLPLLWGSGILYAIAAVTVGLFGVSGLLPEAWWTFIIFLGIAAVYTYLAFERPRRLIWATALLAYFWAYWSFLALPFLEDRSFFIGFLYLWPALAFLTLDLYASKFFAKERILQKWPRIYGTITAAIVTVILIVEGSGEPLRAAITFAILATFLILYASKRRIARLGYLAPSAYALSVYFLLLHLNIENLTFPLAGLGLIYYLGGTLLLQRQKANLWARPLYFCGLVLIGLMAVFKPGLVGEARQLILLVLSFAAFLSADLYEHERKPRQPGQRTFIRLATLFISVYSIVMAVNLGPQRPLYAALAFTAFAILTLAYALLRKNPNVAFFSTAALATAAAYLLVHFKAEDLTYPLLGLGVAYALGGYALFNKRDRAAWARAVHYSGLVLIGLVAAWQTVIADSQQKLIVSVFAVIAFVLADLAEGRRKPKVIAYRNFTRLAALALSLYSLANLTSYGKLHPLAAAAALLVFAALFLFYAILSKAPRIAFLASAAAAGTVFYLQKQFGLDNWLPGLAGLSLVYLLISNLAKWRKGAKDQWKNMLDNSSLALNVIVALGALQFVEGLSVFSVAVVATIFAFQAFRLKNVGRAVLADFLYLEAYLLALNILDVHELQYYSIGAALLGLVMHYMLARSHVRPVWVFIAGLLSQLVLLSTTYYQMVSTEEFQYFFILFFQSLAVITYGIVVRSRSLVAVPIGFIVLEVVSVIYSRLSGISTLVIIGGTGILLLILAIVALLMRERISDTTEKVKARLSSWSA